MNENEKLAFTEDTLTEWAFDVSRKKPSQVKEAEMPFAHTAVGMTFGSSPTGAYVRFSTEEDKEITLFLNVAVAKYLRQALKQGGEISGWMNDEGNITFPVLQK